MSDQRPHNERKILVVATAGGYTNIAPILEIATILADRGYSISIGTLGLRELWKTRWPQVSRWHVLGPCVPEDIEEANYIKMSDWPDDLTSNWPIVFESKRFLESSWPTVYRSLTAIVQDPASRPNIILADYLVDAARDVSREHNIPLAMHWPQMPTAMLAAPHIPGTPGLQVDVLTSEFASLGQRIQSSLTIYTSLPQYVQYLRWLKRMRQMEGVSVSLPVLNKPDYLCLVNSFFGIETAKDLPPNVAAIGPVLSNEVPELPAPYTNFLENRRKVLYIALGTHVLLPHETIGTLLDGSIQAFNSGLIDGIIWSLNARARKQLQAEASWSVVGESEDGLRHLQIMTLSQLLDNQHPAIMFTEFSPQRSLLQDHRVQIFISHAGASSTMEATYAGIPVITLPVYFDQTQNAMRLRDAGVSVSLKKKRLSSTNVKDAITAIVTDLETNGPIAINVQRISGIARVAARRKFLAADLIEEHLLDWKGRQLERKQNSRQTRGMHLQTADARMPWWKARNWDLMAVFTLMGVGLVACVVVVIAVPVLYLA